MNSWNLDESRHYGCKAQRDTFFALAFFHISHALVENIHQLICNYDNKCAPRAVNSVSRKCVWTRWKTCLRKEDITQSSCRMASCYSRKNYASNILWQLNLNRLIWPGSCRKQRSTTELIRHLVRAGRIEGAVAWPFQTNVMITLSRAFFYLQRMHTVHILSVCN